MLSCSLMQNLILFLMAKILLLKNVIVWWHLIFPTEIPLIMSVPASLLLVVMVMVSIVTISKNDYRHSDFVMLQEPD